MYSSAVDFASASRNVRKRLRPNHPPESRSLSFPAIGKCLARKIVQEKYSPYGVRCPLCGAPKLHKCVSGRGILTAVTHAARECLAADLYREQVRRAADSKNLVKDEGVASGDARHPLFSLGSKVSGRDSTPRSNQQSAVSFRELP